MMTISLPRACLLAVAFSAAFLSSVNGAVETGRPAPDFQLTDVTGKSHRLSDFKGRTVVLEWTNPGCPVVQRHYHSGAMQRTQQAATADGVVWLAVQTGPGTDAAAQAWLGEQKAAATAYLRDTDGKVGRAYAAKATPHLYVIDAKGTLVYQGAIDDQPSAGRAETLKAHNYVGAALASLKAGRPIEKANTQAYGCAVKYPRGS